MLQCDELNKLDRVFHTLSSLGTDIAIVISKAQCSEPFFLHQDRIALSARRIHAQAKEQETPGISQIFHMIFSFLTLSIFSLKTQNSTDCSVDPRGSGAKAVPELSRVKWSDSRV